MAQGGTIKPPETLEEIQACEDIETIQKWLDMECKAWDHAKMHTSKVAYDPFMIDMQLNTLIKYLIDKGIIDEDEINLTFKRTVLYKMREIRNIAEPELRQARIDALRSAIVPDIFGPNGNKI